MITQTVEVGTKCFLGGLCSLLLRVISIIEVEDILHFL